MSETYRVLLGMAAVQVGCAALPAGCNRSATQSGEIREQGDPAMKTIVLTSSAFEQKRAVPRKHTGDGEDKSPPLTWSGLPEGTRELALIVDDPDAPSAEPWVHWVIYKIPADAEGLPQGVPPAANVSSPGGALQGKNSWGKIGYGGPAPPKGHGVHRYFFRLYALDAPVNLAAGATKAALLKAMSGHVLAEGVLIGTYQR